MDKFDDKGYFDAFIRTAQYLATLSPEADFWLQLGKVMTVFFGADLAIFGELKQGEACIHHCTSTDERLCAGIFAGTQETMAQVLESGFMASEVIRVPEPYSVAFLPIIQESRPIAVMAVAHRSASPLPKGALNIYLAVAGLAGTTLANLASQERLQQSKRDLEKALEEMQKFARLASHDLQEPLRMVASYVQLLQKKYANQLDAKGAEYCSFAVEGAVRMQDMIHDLLQYSRIDTKGEPFRPTDLEIVLRNTLASLGADIETSGAEITHEDLPTVIADPSQMKVLFQNLIGNAIKFRSIEPPLIQVRVQKQAGEWLFSVKDNGIGIDPRYTQRIFDVFERLHRRGEYPGTGMGLAVCKKIVERHGGRIRAESQVGRGSTFFFTIPALQD